jgi:hypothetical protein
MEQVNMTKLTDHEMEVLGHLAQGYSQHESAKNMNIEYKTFNHAVQSITKKHRGLQRALEWYREHNQDKFEADELPDLDEPEHTPVRCERCQLDMAPIGKSQGHRCIDPIEHIYRPHTGTALRQMGGNGKWTNGYGQGEQWSVDATLQYPVGAGRGRK